MEPLLDACGGVNWRRVQVFRARPGCGARRARL